MKKSKIYLSLTEEDLVFGIPKEYIVLSLIPSFLFMILIYLITGSSIAILWSILPFSILNVMGFFKSKKDPYFVEILLQKLKYRKCIQIYFQIEGKYYQA